MVSWATLPSHVLLYTFAYFDMWSLLRCARVCRSWNRVASDDRLWTAPLANIQVIYDRHSLDNDIRERARLGSLMCYKDVFLLACPLINAADFNDTAASISIYDANPHVLVADIHRYLECRYWHPRRHLDACLPNALRLLKCFILEGPDTFKMMGKTLAGRRWVPFFHNDYAAAWEKLIRYTLITTGVTLSGLFIALLLLTYALPLSALVPMSWRTAYCIARLALVISPLGLMAGLLDGVRYNRSAPHLRSRTLSFARDSFIQPTLVAIVLLFSLYLSPLSTPLDPRNIVTSYLLSRLLQSDQKHKWLKAAIVITSSAFGFLIPPVSVAICAYRASVAGAVIKKCGWGPWPKYKKES